MNSTVCTRSSQKIPVEKLPTSFFLQFNYSWLTFPFVFALVGLDHAGAQSPSPVAVHDRMETGRVAEARVERGGQEALGYRLRANLFRQDHHLHVSHICRRRSCLYRRPVTVFLLPSFLFKGPIFVDHFVAVTSRRFPMTCALFHF